MESLYIRYHTSKNRILSEQHKGFMERSIERNEQVFMVRSFFVILITLRHFTTQFNNNMAIGSFEAVALKSCFELRPNHFLKLFSHGMRFLLALLSPGICF